jgi:hypothetical protein
VRVANALLALRIRAQRENLTMCAIAMPLYDRNELATEQCNPHIASFLGVPIIVSERVRGPSIVVGP